MKICFVTRQYLPSVGGLQLLVHGVATRLGSEYGHRVRVITSAGRGLKSTSETLDGIFVDRYPVVPLAPTVAKVLYHASVAGRIPGRGYIEPVRLGPISPGMYRAIRELSEDLVCASPLNYLTAHLPLLGSPSSRPPTVLLGTLHLQTARKTEILVRAVRTADHYVALTPFERETVLRWGAEPRAVTVIPPGVDPSEFESATGAAVRERFGLSDAPVVGYLGRQGRYKGIDVLIRAMAQVWESLPGCFLLIAGRRLPDSVAIDRLLTQLPVERRNQVIRIDDFAMSQRASLFAACDVIVNVSTQESFGIVFLEAWSCGKPVVAADSGATRSVVIDGENGLVIRSGDHGALAAALGRLLSDSALRQHLGRSGHHAVCTRYSWEVVGYAWNALCERLVL